MADRGEIVKALLAEMRHKLETATPQTQHDHDRSILVYSDIIASLVQEPSDPIFWAVS